MNLRRWPNHPAIVILLASLLASLSPAFYVIALSRKSGMWYAEFGKLTDAVRISVKMAALVLPAVFVLAAMFWLGYRRRLAGLRPALTAAAWAAAAIAPMVLATFLWRDFTWWHRSLAMILRDFQTHHVYQMLFACAVAVPPIVLGQLLGRFWAAWRIRRGKAEYIDLAGPGGLKRWIDKPAGTVFAVWLFPYVMAVTAGGLLSVWNPVLMQEPFTRFDPARFGNPEMTLWLSINLVAFAALPAAVLAGAVLLFIRTRGGQAARLLAILTVLLAITIFCGSFRGVSYAEANLAGAATGRYVHIYWNLDHNMFIGPLGMPYASLPDFPLKVSWLYWLPLPVLHGLQLAAFLAPWIVGPIAVAYALARLLRWRRGRTTKAEPHLSEASP